MVLLNQKTELNLVSNPPSLSQLPTFKPNRDYVDLLLSLSKLPENEKKNRTDKYLRIKVQLIQMESKMSSEEIIANTKLAFPKATKI